MDSYPSKMPPVPEGFFPYKIFLRRFRSYQQRRPPAGNVLLAAPCLPNDWAPHVARDLSSNKLQATDLITLGMFIP
jgi:hypothetical protein